MRQLILVLACSTCLTHGRRARSSGDDRQNGALDASQRPNELKAFAELLLGSDAGAAFNPSGQAPRTPNRNPSLARPRVGLGQHAARMQELWENDDDPSIPRGVPYPPKDTVLRECRVTKVTEEGVWVEVDPETGLNGFIYPMGCDNAYVRNLENTFRVGDKLDAKAIEVSGINGKLLLSRKILMDDEGWEKHELPDDGRERPRRDRSEPSKKDDDIDWGWGDPENPACPKPGSLIPPDGTILRGLPVVKVTEKGVWCLVDETQDPDRGGLQGFIYPMGVDQSYIKNLEDTIKVGDLLDAKSLGVSGITGEFMLSRKQLQDMEGREKHELPDDGRIQPR